MKTKFSRFSVLGKKPVKKPFQEAEALANHYTIGKFYSNRLRGMVLRSAHTENFENLFFILSGSYMQIYD